MSTRHTNTILLLIACLLTMTACGSADQSTARNHQQLMAADSSTGGEGVYGGAEVALQAITDDVTYITQLGLMRGHLLVGVQLYRRGEQEAAATHMKHPEDELYTALVPAFAARGAVGMDRELSALARAVESGQPAAVVDDAYQVLLDSITAAEQVAELAPREMGQVITALVSTAAEEYLIAREDDGRVVNVHEYQDSFGFVQVARQLQEKFAAGSADEGAVATIGELLASIAPTWPDLIPPPQLPTVPAALFSAAARIEIASLRL